MANSIYFIEPDQQFGEKVTEAFSSFGYPLEILPDFTSFFQRLKQKPADAIYIQHNLLADLDDLKEMLQNHFTVAYGKDIEHDRKLEYYRMGFSRVLDQDCAQPDLLLQFLKVNFYLKNELRPLIVSRITQGNLREFRLIDILYNSLLQKRNIIIKIEDDQWFAKVRTFQGHLIEAICPGNQGIDALLEILRHQNGRLRLQSYERTQEESRGFCSTFAIVNEARQQENIFHNFQTKVGNKNPIFRKNTRFKKQFMPYPEEEIYKLIGGSDGLHTLLRKSPFGLLTTIRSLEKLLEIKAITFDKKKAKMNQFSPEDYDLMRERLTIPGRNEGLILILGGKDSGKTEFMKTLANVSGVDLDSRENTEMFTMPLDENSRLQIVGIPTNADVDSFVRKNMTVISSSLLLINIRNRDNFEYIKYFLKQFLANYHVSLVVGFTQIAADSKDEIERVRGELEIPLQIEALEINPENFQSLRGTFYQLMDLPIKENR